MLTSKTRKGTAMQAQWSDGMTRKLGEFVTRRGMVRLLAGAVAAGAGITMAAQDEGLAKRRVQVRERGREEVSAQGKGKKVTICFQGQTLTVKKNKLASYPGAFRGVCPIVEPPPLLGLGPDPQPYL
jgi:hypothetical protein